MNGAQDVYQAPPLFLAFMPEMADGVILVAFQDFLYRTEPQGEYPILPLSDDQAEHTIFFLQMTGAWFFILILIRFRLVFPGHPAVFQDQITFQGIVHHIGDVICFLTVFFVYA